MRKLWVFIFMVALSAATRAQTDPEYRMEVGAGFGMMGYLGDFNGNLLKGLQPWGSIIAKYRMNPRMAWSFNAGMGKAKGSTDDAETWYPIERYEFDGTLIEADLRYEYNFWAFGTGREYRGAKRLTPFITVGIGITHFDADKKGIAMNLPIGAGVKYKLGQRLNLTAEWVMRFSTSDNLDGRSDVYGIKSSGLFKNTDCYHVFQVALSYDLWVKCNTCNNDRD